MITRPKVLRAIFQSAERRDASRKAALISSPEMPEQSDGIYPDFADDRPQGKHASGHKTPRGVNRKRASKRAIEKKTRRKNR